MEALLGERDSADRILSIVNRRISRAVSNPLFRLWNQFLWTVGGRATSETSSSGNEFVRYNTRRYHFILRETNVPLRPLPISNLESGAAILGDRRRGKGDVSYRAGEGLVVKPNWVGMIWREGAVDPESYTLVKREDYMKTDSLFAPGRSVRYGPETSGTA